ncbi:MAG TPA: NAD-dependent epimerase/dehydratase family protein, partial [Acidimicrobiales bacterium]|nr:NAD-dependent epimerase/dehydratase family protein [Acidimicrobiales bacterium]
MEGTRILVTGPTGQVAKPVTLAFAEHNEVIGVARFKDARARAELESAGVRCIPVDLAAGDLSAVPSDVDYVLNLAVSKTTDFDHDLAANAEATGLLMSHCRTASAFLHCSSTAVYQPDGHRAFR